MPWRWAGGCPWRTSLRMGSFVIQYTKDRTRRAHVQVALYHLCVLIEERTKARKRALCSSLLSNISVYTRLSQPCHDRSTLTYPNHTLIQKPGGLVEDYCSSGAGGIEIRLILKGSKVEDKKMIIALLYCTPGFVWTLRYASRRVEVIKYR
jgi:hypothetical protein